MDSSQQIRMMVDGLVNEGRQLFDESSTVDCVNIGGISAFAGRYAGWYARARKLLVTTVSLEIKEFDNMYKSDNKEDKSSISDFFNDPKKYKHLREGGYYTRDDDRFRQFQTRFASQIAFVEAIPSSLEYERFRLSQLVARDILSDELEQAKLLLEKDFVECAGMLAGVAIERSLKTICDNNTPKIEYFEKETLGSLNDKLKNYYLDPADYLRVKSIKTTRDRCSHDPGTKPPTKKDVEVMIVDAETFIKNH